MSDEYAVQRKAGEVIQAGKLPNRWPERTWGGPGAGAECGICGAPVRADDTELEVEFARNGNDSGMDRYHVHLRCFAAWVSERQNGASC